MNDCWRGVEILLCIFDNLRWKKIIVLLSWFSFTEPGAKLNCTALMLMCFEKIMLLWSNRRKACRSEKVKYENMYVRRKHSTNVQASHREREREKKKQATVIQQENKKKANTHPHLYIIYILKTNDCKRLLKYNPPQPTEQRWMSVYHKIRIIYTACTIVQKKTTFIIQKHAHNTLFHLKYLFASRT